MQKCDPNMQKDMIQICQKICDSNMQKCNVMQICKSGDSGGMMVARARGQILIKICNEGEGGGVEGW